MHFRNTGGGLGGGWEGLQQGVCISELMRMGLARLRCTTPSGLQPLSTAPNPLLKPPQPHHAAGRSPLPYHEAVRVDLGAAAAAEQDPRVADDGAGGELLAFEGRGAGQQLVQVLRDIHGAVPVKDVVDDVPRLQRPLQHRNVLLRIQELQDLFPEDRGENSPIR